MLALAAPAGAVTLVNPDGSPVGGQWQRWADEAKVPTYRGTVVFQPVSLRCRYADGASVQGCSSGPRYGQPYELVASDRGSLYFELGHIFDWSRLTWWKRHHIARRLWHTRWHWRDSQASVDQGVEDGLEGIFPAAYASCAWGRSWGGTSALVMSGSSIRMPPAIYPTTDTATCAYIRRVS